MNIIRPPCLNKAYLQNVFIGKLQLSQSLVVISAYLYLGICVGTRSNFPPNSPLGGHAFWLPLLHWTEVYPRVPGFIPVQWNNRRQKQACPPSGTLAEKFDWVVEEWPNYNQELVYCYKDGTRAKEDLCRFLDPGREVKISPGLIVFFSV